MADSDTGEWPEVEAVRVAAVGPLHQLASRLPALATLDATGSLLGRKGGGFELGGREYLRLLMESRGGELTGP